MRFVIASLAFALSASAAAAETCGNTADGFKPFIQQMKQEAAAAGVSKRSIAVLDTVTYDTAIIKRDRGQSIFSDSFLTFQKKMISAGRLARAKSQIEKYQDRLRRVGAAMYGAMGITRDDDETRANFAKANCVSFGAPVLLLCHFPKLMKEPQWSDVGMWLQTIMLLLRGEGLDSCPQEYMGLYGRTIKQHLGLSEDTLLFCGLAIGKRDPSSPVNVFERERVPLGEQITFLGFDG